MLLGMYYTNIEYNQYIFHEISFQFCITLLACISTIHVTNHKSSERKQEQTDFQIHLSLNKVSCWKVNAELTENNPHTTISLRF